MSKSIEPPTWRSARASPAALPEGAARPLFLYVVVEVVRVEALHHDVLVEAWHQRELNAHGAKLAGRVHRVGNLLERHSVFTLLTLLRCLNKFRKNEKFVDRPV
jgi:hypothetical protein